WTRFVRVPRPHPRYSVDAKAEIPTEAPRALGRVGNQVILFAASQSGLPTGNWHVRVDGQLSLLTLPEGKWRLFDAEQDLAADELNFLVGQDGEILVSSNRGAHRWSATRQAWQFLDT